MPNRLCFFTPLLLSAGLLFADPAFSRTSLPPYIKAALQDPARGDVKDIDARRKPGEIIAFSGAKPGDKIADLIPGSGYFTKIFAKVVGRSGRVYMVWPDEYARHDVQDVEGDKALAKSRDYRNVTIVQQPAAAFSVPEPVDLVFTSQNYHDYPDAFMGKIDPLDFGRAVFRSLKPGGVFLVIDHVAPTGSGLRDTDTLHRIDPEIVKAELTSIGFKFQGSSSVLRNRTDDHRQKVFDPSVRGHTDQFIFKFLKPRGALS